MTEPRFHGQTSAYSASRAIEALAKALGEIKAQDRLTYADIGAVLGKSEDQAAKYCDGSATMDAVTLGRGRREWGSRFTGYFDRLCDAGKPSAEADRLCEAALIRAALALSLALADDNAVDAAEVRSARSVLEDARDALDAQLGKLRLAA